SLKGSPSRLLATAKQRSRGSLSECALIEIAQSLTRLAVARIPLQQRAQRWNDVSHSNIRRKEIGQPIPAQSTTNEHVVDTGTATYKSYISVVRSCTPVRTSRHAH